MGKAKWATIIVYPINKLSSEKIFCQNKSIRGCAVHVRIFKNYFRPPIPLSMHHTNSLNPLPPHNDRRNFCIAFKILFINCCHVESCFISVAIKIKSSINRSVHIFRCRNAFRNDSTAVGWGFHISYSLQLKAMVLFMGKFSTQKNFLRQRFKVEWLLTEYLWHWINLLSSVKNSCHIESFSLDNGVLEPWHICSLTLAQM